MPKPLSTLTVSTNGFPTVNSANITVAVNTDKSSLSNYVRVTLFAVQNVSHDVIFDLHVEPRFKSNYTLTNLNYYANIGLNRHGNLTIFV